MAWQDDSVPDAIEDDPPLTDDVATPRQNGTHSKSHLRGMGQSAFFMLHITYDEETVFIIPCKIEVTRDFEKRFHQDKE